MAGSSSVASFLHTAAVAGGEHLEFDFSAASDGGEQHRVLDGLITDEFEQQFSHGQQNDELQPYGLDFLFRDQHENETLPYGQQSNGQHTGDLGQQPSGQQDLGQQTRDLGQQPSGQQDLGQHTGDLGHAGQRDLGLEHVKNKLTPCLAALLSASKTEGLPTDVVITAMTHAMIEKQLY